jgi:hypothetical protein
MYHVKWENYPAKKDWTWEPEEHLATGAKEILESYHDSLPNGKPEKPAPKKRGRQSLVQAALASAKKPRTGVTATPAKNKKAGTEKVWFLWLSMVLTTPNFPALSGSPREGREAVEMVYGD